MKKASKKNFTKLTRKSGISLIVLVITIIVILILAAAVIITLNNNNPIAEANKARYESDRANMQAIFTLTVGKVMTQNRATVSITAGQINDVITGVKETKGTVNYTVKNALNSNNASGTIEFDKGDNTEKKYYTGKKLPIYAAGDTKWYVDSEGNISLEVAGVKYGEGEIVTGTNPPETNTNTLVSLYEDLAGDEEGATEGKLHIGDYVDYNPIASGITEKTVANGYKYVSTNDVTGVTDAKESGNTDYSYVSTVTEQSFTAQDNLKWRVLGIDGDNILITTEGPIMPDNPITDQWGYTGYFMYGAKAYINAIQELDNIAAVYGNGDLAESADAMTIEDVNKITGVTVTDTAISPSGVEANTTIGWNAYGSEYSFAAGSGYGWSPETWLEKEDGDTDLGISGKVDGYAYELANTNLKTADTTSVRYDLIYKNSATYYLASRGVFANSDYADFGPGAVVGGCAASCLSYFHSYGVSGGFSFGVRPVVSLKSGVLGELQSTDANGVSTWNISLN